MWCYRKGRSLCWPLENFLSCAFARGCAERHSVSAFQEQIPDWYLNLPRPFVHNFSLEKLAELTRSYGRIWNCLERLENGSISVGCSGREVEELLMSDFWYFFPRRNPTFCPTPPLESSL